MKRCLLAVTAACAPIFGSAAPVYLACMMSVGDAEKVPWNLTVDEAAGTVVYSIPSTGNTQKAPGIFTADKVMFAGSFELSRVDLTLKRTIALISRTDTGPCEIVKEPVRKF